MAGMVRSAVLATLLLLASGVAQQPTATLRIRIVLQDEAGQPTPVPRHTLLISENPTGALPRRVVTGRDGTAEIKLRPGNYTVESDRPTAFQPLLTIPPRRTYAIIEIEELYDVINLAVGRAIVVR